MKYDDMTEANSGNAPWVAVLWADSRGLSSGPSLAQRADQQALIDGTLSAERYVAKWHDYQLMSDDFNEAGNAFFSAVYAEFVKAVLAWGATESLRRTTGARARAIFERGSVVLDELFEAWQRRSEKDMGSPSRSSTGRSRSTKAKKRRRGPGA